MEKLLLLYTPLAILLLLFAILARTYLLAVFASSKDRTTVARLLRERRAVDFIFKQFGAVAAIVAAVVAALYGFVQFTEDEKHKEYLQQEKEFSQGVGKLYSEKQEESIGGIVAISQLAHSDANRHWKAMEALTGYIRSTVPLVAPTTKRRIPRNRNKKYSDPPVSTQPEEAFDYKPVNDVPPANTVAQIGAQMALTAIGIRNLAFEQTQKIQDIPRASIYLKPSTPADQEGCKRENVIKHLNGYLDDANLMRSDADAINYEIIIESSPICFGLHDIPFRQWINLSHSNFVAMNLDNLSLDGVTFADSDLSFADLNFAHLAKVLFTNSSLVGANLWSADLREADFRWADVRGANLGKAKLGLAWMSGGNFYRANFFEANLENASLVGANMQELQTMGGSNMDGVIGFRADFSNAHIGGGERVSMKGAYLRSSAFRKAILTGVDLRNSDFEGADLTGTNFTTADLTDADLKGANMAGAELPGSILLNTDIRGVDLTQTSGLTADQISKARLDSGTKLPRELASASAQSIPLTAPVNNDRR